MPTWPDRRYLELVGIEHPIVQAPMAGAAGAELAIAVAEAGGLGSLPCGMLGVAEAGAQLDKIRQHTDRPINVNVFCHVAPQPDAAGERRWRERLARYYAELKVAPSEAPAGASRTPFGDDMCALLLAKRPRVVSFHYGLPAPALIERLKGAGAIVQSSATTVAEARWLEQHGADAIIAQGLDAGGHRGMFLTDDLAQQVGTFALIPQIADAVRVPVIAAGGIADARGMVAALALGASAVQIGTGYLLCPEATISAAFRSALRSAADDSTKLTNVFSGRPARSIVNRLMRELGPLCADAPPFPLAAAALQPLRRAAEAAQSADFSPLLAGQAAPLARAIAAGALTRALAGEAQALLQRLGQRA